MKSVPEESWSQIAQAIDDARAASKILIIERGMWRGRPMLSQHFLDQALAPATPTGTTQAYVSLYGHPHRPAHVVCNGRASTSRDLAQGTVHDIYAASQITVDGPESMLNIMPARLSRFLRCCSAEGKLLVVLTENARRLLDLGILGLVLCVDASVGFRGNAVVIHQKDGRLIPVENQSTIELTPTMRRRGSDGCS